MTIEELYTVQRELLDRKQPHESTSLHTIAILLSEIVIQLARINMTIGTLEATIGTLEAK